MKVLEWRKSCIALLLASGFSSPAASAPISFNQQVQPILSEYCYPCHGPDSSTRKPKKLPLRLDQERFAFEPREEGKPVIIKGDPKASELVRRINAKDDDIMPPPSEHKTLKPADIALLEEWIAQGAKYEKHWSLIPPTRPPVPKADGNWSKNPIDAFVALKLQERGLTPNAEEKKARLFRRLCFDLTGLPPAPEELQRFLNDPSASAYGAAVDRLLASDSCAEHFTRHWLDAVRYADTQGIHHDHARSIWPYRDWVIGAFKSNMPFDKFTIEQIAGDLLPSPTLDQKIASGYNRLLPTTGEGGAIPDEYAAIYAKDRVETTSAVWLGLTTGCATCHDHKFDPISMKDFYALTAFFRNNTTPALDSGGNGNTAPMLFVPAKEDRSRWTELETALEQKTRAIEERKGVARPDFEKWLAQSNHFSSSEPAAVVHLPLNETNGAFHGSAEGAAIEWTGTTERRPGPLGPAPLIEGGTVVEKARPDLPRNGQASYGALIFVEGKPNGALLSRMDKSDGYRGWDLFFTEGRPTVHIVESWPDTSLKVTAKQPLKPGVWHHLMAVFDGTQKGAEAISVYVDGRKAEVEVNNNNLGAKIVAKAPLRLGGRSEGDQAVDKLSGKVFLQDLRFYDRALRADELARLAGAGLVADFLADPAGQRTAEQTNSIYEVFLAGFDAPMQKLQNEMGQLNREQEKFRARGATTLIIAEKKDSSPVAHILTRGNYAAKGEQVSAATPQALPVLQPEPARNRLGLAQWLMEKQNPLTARVTVNRLWSQLFGIGIVETTEDFGIKGARPTNQDLLDWLAIEFIESGWDLRSMVKTMVMSATYRQSEIISPDKLEKDPGNRFFARGPHVRLDAEQIRDQALAASGLLVAKVGGPPVKPYQPEGVWEAVAMKDSNTRVYKQDEGEALYRRSLYTFWKRTAPPPTMEILNAPSREVFCTRRERTDTPLQAFVTLNDPQFVEASRQLAAKAWSSGKSFDERLDAVTERLLARRFSREERALVQKLAQRAFAAYQADRAAAESLITVGESKPDGKVPAAELATWTLVASQIMNLDESLTK